ncbi:kinase-like domain protein [Fusarium sp. NRRL 52700]|nr:kinase-like domain protein [Fusarium sp. NRRL 52700]
MDEELESEDPAIEHLQKHIDNLAPDVFEIRVSPQDDLVSTSIDQEDDNIFCPYHLFWKQPSVHTELKPSQDSDKKLVFKYYFLDHRRSYVWHEMNHWMRLPNHQHIVAFDKIVVDEIEGRCV